MASSDFYPFESTFEVSDFTEWTSTVDTQSKMEVIHLLDIVKKWGNGFPGVAPYRGNYVDHINIALGTADAYAQTTVVTAALGTTIWVRFFLQVTNNLVMATSDRFTILSVQSAGAVEQGTISILNNVGIIQLVAAQTGSTAIGALTVQAEFERDIYHLVELGMTIDSGAADGTLQFWLDGNQVGSTITGLTQAAITQMRLGAIGIDAGTTAGHLLFDQVVQALTHVDGFYRRYPQVVVLTKSGFIALGPGKIEEYTLVAGGAVDNHMSVYDLDRQPLLGLSDFLGPELTNSHAFEAKVFAYSKKDGYFNRGLYVRLIGTAPRATVTLGAGQTTLGTLRQYAIRKY